MGLFDIFPKKEKFKKQIILGVDMVKMGLSIKLRNKFSIKYQDNAKLMAEVVINTIFNTKLSNKQAESFAKSNKEAINNEIEELLVKDAEARKMIITSLRTLNMDIMVSGKDATESIFDKYSNILVKHGKRCPESPPDEFLKQAGYFYIKQG